MNHLTTDELITLALDAHDNPLAKLLAERIEAWLDEEQETLGELKEDLSTAENTIRSMDGCIFRLRNKLFPTSHRYLDALQGTLVTDSLTLDELRNQYAPDMGSLAGAIMVTTDGEYDEIWVTDGAAPYDLCTLYRRVW